MNSSDSQPSQPNCRGCSHYQITHDPAFPYGCKAFGIKSARQPIRDVMEASSQRCLYFEARQRKPDHRE